MPLSITSIFEVAVEHHLPYHLGKCHRRHGHNLVLRFSRYGTPQTGTHSEAGMVMDFATFDAPIKTLLETVDHYSLNDDVGLPNPTAELLAAWLLDHLPLVDQVEVWETSRHYVTLARDRAARAD